MGIFTRLRLNSLEKDFKQLLLQDSQNKSEGELIKGYLLKILDDNHNDREKFSPSQISEAEKIYNQVGPTAFYWMADIAASMVDLLAAKYNEIPTNLDLNINGRKTPESIVNEVVRTSAQ